jgi:RHS repeat-associated protein
LDNHYKFTGKERDGETGLDYFGARYYSNSMGRFLTPDWAAKATAVPYAELSDPQSLNLYSYVRNRPTVLVDPDGHILAGPQCGSAQECTRQVAGADVLPECKSSGNKGPCRAWDSTVYEPRTYVGETQLNESRIQVTRRLEIDTYDSHGNMVDRITNTATAVFGADADRPGNGNFLSGNLVVNEGRPDSQSFRLSYGQAISIFGTATFAHAEQKALEITDYFWSSVASHPKELGLRVFGHWRCRGRRTDWRSSRYSACRG